MRYIIARAGEGEVEGGDYAWLTSEQTSSERRESLLSIIRHVFEENTLRTNRSRLQFRARVAAFVRGVGGEGEEIAVFHPCFIRARHHIRNVNRSLAILG